MKPTLFLATIGLACLAVGEWIELIGAGDLDRWRHVSDGLVVAGDAELDGDNARHLKALPGTGVLVGEKRTGNLHTRESFGDCELHLEFMLAKRSNSGVKLHGHYEIQLLDSYGRKKLKGSDCGGVYPHWKWTGGRFTYLDDGVPPACNAAKPAGEWQTLDIIFQAPRFDEPGKKTANARFIRVELNGRVIHDDVELKSPTGFVTLKAKEVAKGPLMLQCDHGAVAFRNVRIRER